MRDLRGTVILCDQLYPVGNGKWVIAGTYTAWWVRPGERHIEFPTGLHAYLRFQVERAGDYACEVHLVDRGQAANAPPLLRHAFRVNVTDPLNPVEVGCMLPPCQVRPPEGANPAPGAPVAVHLQVCLRVGDEEIATCPLNVVFQAPGAQPPQ